MVRNLTLHHAVSVILLSYNQFADSCFHSCMLSEFSAQSCYSFIVLFTYCTSVSSRVFYLLRNHVFLQFLFRHSLLTPIPCDVLTDMIFSNSPPNYKLQRFCPVRNVISLDVLYLQVNINLILRSQF